MFTKSLQKTNQHVITKFKLCTAAIVLGAALAVTSYQATANSEPAYNTVTMANWMSAIPDQTNITELSLMGTHDTMAYQVDTLNLLVVPWVKTQSTDMDLLKQLNSGVRFLDIRARHVGDRFSMYHGEYYLGNYFGHVMDVVMSFLQQNPSETIYMRFKDNERSPENNTRSSTDTLAWYLDSYASMIHTNEYLLSLGATRGKLVIFDNFEGESPYAPIQYGQVGFNIQDAFELGHNQDGMDKWSTVLAHINTADYYQFGLFLNYMSAYNPGSVKECWTPPFFCTTNPMTPKNIADTVNPHAITHLQTQVDAKALSHTGFMIADFVSPQLIDAVTRVNFTDYKAPILNAGLPIGYSGDNTEYAAMPNGDLMMILKRGTGTGTTELHTLSAASNYSQWILHTGTALPEVALHYDVKYLVLSNNDLMMVLKNATGTQTTEVHILTAVSGYTQFRLNTGTALHETGENWDFVLAPNDDLFAVAKYATGSGKVEIHKLSAASNYTQFSAQIATGLGGMSFHDLDVAVAPNDDLMIMTKTRNEFGRVAAYTLSATANYSQYEWRSTGLGETVHANQQDLRMMGNGDILQILRYGASSGLTEVNKIVR